MILQKTIASKAPLSSFSLPGNDTRGRAGMALLALMLAQLTIWLVFPLLGHQSPPLDAIEMHTWAALPQMGYFKHPPLPAWVVWASEAVLGRQPLALFLPSALSVALCTLALWPLSLRLLGARRAVLAAFLQSTLLYASLYAPDYNHNVAQMPFWALTVTCAYFALADGAGRWWFATGLALGVTALAKYSALFLALALLLLLVVEPAARRHLSPGRMALAALGTLLVFGPHLAWLVMHDFASRNWAIAPAGASASAPTWAPNCWPTLPCSWCFSGCGVRPQPRQRARALSGASC